MKLPLFSLFCLAFLLADLPLAAKEGDALFMGVVPSEIPAEVQQQSHVQAGEGIFIRAVVPGSPAEKAGLKAGDVITWIDDREKPDREVCRDVLSGKKAGDPLSVIYVRAGKWYLAVITLISRDDFAGVIEHPEIKTEPPASSGEQRRVTSSPGRMPASPGMAHAPSGGPRGGVASPGMAHAPSGRPRGGYASSEIYSPGTGSVSSGASVPADVPASDGVKRGDALRKREDAYRDALGVQGSRSIGLPGEIRRSIYEAQRRIAEQMGCGPDGLDPKAVIREMQAIRNLARDANRSRDHWMEGKAGEVTLRFRDDDGVLIVTGMDNLLTVEILDARGKSLFRGPLNTPEERRAAPVRLYERFLLIKDRYRRL